MSYINENDRHYIENKYHRTDEAFDPFDRLNYHGYEYDASTGLDDTQMHDALEALFDETRTLPHALAKAKGFAFVLDNARIDVSPNDYFFGLYNWARPLTKTFLSKWNKEVFDTMPDIKELMHDYNVSGTAELWLDTEHAVPYWVDILKLGFPGLLERVRTYHKNCADPTPEKAALDAYAFGFKYPTSCLMLCSFATTVDSILAVKELVFEKKAATLAELKDALQHNWEGYEDLRRLALNARDKYGNANKQADLYAAALFRWFSVYVTGQKNSRSGVYKVGVPSTLHFIMQGKVTQATPDGRKEGEECSKNTAPVIGMERGGVTAMIRSALATGPWLFSEAYVLDVMLHPSAVSGADGLDAMKGLIDTYMKHDGISIQFNIFSVEKLRDAQAHPEKYKNLQVRVSGWNVLWNDLSREDQEAYIKRAESFGS